MSDIKHLFYLFFFFFFFKQKTAYEIVDCDWSSDVCSSDLLLLPSRPVFLGLPTAMEGSPILDDDRDLPCRLQMLLGLLGLPVHQGQIALGVETTHHEAIVKADMRFPKA